METIGNLTLQFFASFILPLLLPIFLLAFLTGMRSPERLIEGVAGVTEAILGTLFKMVCAILKAAIKALGDLFDKKPVPKYAEKPYSGAEHGGSKQYKSCKFCGSKLPAYSIYCNKCGARQQ